MASIAVLLIMAGCAAYQYFKGTFLRAFATFMAALCASIVAFAWSEQLANLLRNMLSGWAQPVCFVVLFIVTFAVLQTIATMLTREPIDFGVMAERAGRIVLGLFLGLILSGSLLTAAAMAPLPNNYPYPRFDPARPDPQSPSKPLLNPDGFTARWFGIISNGGLGGTKSFAVLHAGFLDHLFLNRLPIGKKIPIFADSDKIELPPKAAVWPAPEGLKDGKGEPLSSKTGCDLIMARLGLTAKTGPFTPSQLRLICKEKSDKQRLRGTAINIYPIGYLRGPGQLQLKGLADQIRPEAQTRWIDFAFYLSAGFEPVAVALKANAIAEVPPLVSADQAPKPIPFIQSSDCTTLFAKVTPATSAKIYGLELASGTRLLEGETLAVADRNGWESMQTQRSIKPAQFDNDQITCGQAELKARTTPAEPNQPDKQPKENKLPQMLKPANGYRLLSLKCNTPAVGSAMRGEQLPTIIDNFATTHRPCGLLAAGKTGDDIVFEFDYCSLTADPSGEISLDDNGAVAKPFPESVWLTEQAESISQLYILYMVKTDTVILSVQPAGAQVSAAFDGAEAFLVN
jgi:hypothetical protein